MDDHRFFDLSVLQKECVQRSIGSVVREPAHEQLRECGIFLQEYGHSFDGHCCKKICVLKLSSNKNRVQGQLPVHQENYIRGGRDRRGFRLVFLRMRIIFLMIQRLPHVQ